MPKKVFARTQDQFVELSDPQSAAMHGRHVYYSRRRNALVQDAVHRADVLHFFSDYTTLPYTEAEWRCGMRAMVGTGSLPDQKASIAATVLATRSLLPQ